MPQWEKYEYFPKVQPLIVQKKIYPQGSNIFEQKKGMVKGIPWTLWVVLVDGKLANKKMEEKSDEKNSAENGPQVANSSVEELVETSNSQKGEPEVYQRIGTPEIFAVLDKEELSSQI